jgi:tRNA A-37 threonylcarbamoyl transferase component Bud32
MPKRIVKKLEDAALAILKAILRNVKRVLKENYGLSNISIKPIGGGAARLSIPCKVIGTRGKERIPYFAKIIGPADFVSSLSMQFLKNLYLQTMSKDPLFDSPASAEEIAKYQYDMLKAMRRIRVPTAKPFGYHPIDEIRWLLVVEFIEAKPMPTIEAKPEDMDRAFKHLKKMHDNRIFHGDIKPDNLMVGEKLYILDVGRFRDGVPIKEKQAYDLACMVCCFLNHFTDEEIIAQARQYYPPKALKEAADYVALIQKRPDFFITDDIANKLTRLMRK